MRGVSSIIFFVEVLISLSLSQPTPDTNHQIVKNGVLNFGVELNSILLKSNTENKNILFSPYNLYIALALVHLGSNGATRDEISNVLGIPKTFSPKSLHEVLQNFSLVAQTSFTLSKYEKGTEVNVKAADLKLAGGIFFVQKEHEIKKVYVEDIQLYHNSEVFAVDFQKKGEETKNIINNDAFYTDKNKITVQMMNSIIDTPYVNISSLGAEILNLKSSDEAFSMFIVMPYKNLPLEKYLRNLTTENINTIIDRTNELYNVDIKLPKTAFKWSKSVKNELIQLGLKAEILHSPDYSNMIEEKKLKLTTLVTVLILKSTKMGLKLALHCYIGYI